MVPWPWAASKVGVLAESGARHTHGTMTTVGLGALLARVWNWAPVQPRCSSRSGTLTSFLASFPLALALLRLAVARAPGWGALGSGRVETRGGGSGAADPASFPFFFCRRKPKVRDCHRAWRAQAAVARRRHSSQEGLESPDSLATKACLIQQKRMTDAFTRRLGCLPVNNL